jgi:hypothetical protein
MKQILVLTCCILLLSAALDLRNNIPGNNEIATSSVSGPNTVSKDQQFIRVYAWQAAPPVTPIEERKSTNWLWWAIGVALAVGGGVLLYFLIKKNPRQDVR